MLDVLKSKQLENGSWFNDEATTCTVLGILMEDQFGPRYFCKYSWLSNQFHPTSGYWPLGLLYETSLLNNKNELGSILAIYKGLFAYSNFDNVRATLPATSRASALFQWARLFSIADPDSWLHYSDWLKLSGTEFEDPVLFAQSALIELHLTVPDHLYLQSSEVLKRKSTVVECVDQLIQLTQGEYWKSSNAIHEEVIAKISDFLFDECTTYLVDSLCPTKQLRNLQEKLGHWIVEHQKDNGGWADSPYITSCCLRVLAMSVGQGKSSSPDGTSFGLSIKKGIKYLFTEDIISSWLALQGSGLRILEVLIELSKYPALADVFNNLNLDGRVKINSCFIDYQ